MTFATGDVFATITYIELTYKHAKPLTKELAIKVEMAGLLELNCLFVCVEIARTKSLIFGAVKNYSSFPATTKLKFTF